MVGALPSGGLHVPSLSPHLLLAPHISLCISMPPPPAISSRHPPYLPASVP